MSAQCLCATINHMQDEKVPEVQKRHFKPLIITVIVVILLGAGVAAYFLLFNQPPKEEAPSSDRDPVAEQRADFNTKAVNGNLTDDDLEKAVSAAETNEAKASTLQQYADYTLLQENVSNESVQKALDAAQRAYELDAKTESLWTIVDAATKLGQTELAQTTQQKIDKEFEGVERHG